MIAYQSVSTDPFFNLSLEELLFQRLRDEDAVIVYRDAPAVVAGCYQNIAAEVDAVSLFRRGIPMLRRISGGGTVYHDLGNINYSMLFRREGFVSYEDFLTPVIAALGRLGIPAERRRSCDIALFGRKISGSAQKVSGGRVLHHGTLLFDSELSLLDEITTGRKSGSFCSKASESAICTVTSIRREGLWGDASAEEFTEALLSELSGEGAERFTPDEGMLSEIERLSEEKYRSWDWTWGKTPGFHFEREGSFRGDKVRISYSARRGIVEEFSLRSPALDEEEARALFEGSRFGPESFSELAGRLAGEDGEELLRLLL